MLLPALKPACSSAMISSACAFILLYYSSAFYTALSHNLIKEKLIDLIERTFQVKDLFTLLVIIGMLSSRLKSIKGTHYGLARRCVKLSYFFWTIFISDLAQSYADKL